MKRVLLIMLVVMTVLTSPVYAKSNKQLITDYVRSQYGRNYRVRIRPAEKTPDSVLEHRRGKHIVYVDMFVTRSCGRHGICTTKGPFKGRMFRYAKRVQKGKKVKVYWIYSPHTNSTDAVDAIVSSDAILK